MKIIIRYIIFRDKTKTSFYGTDTSERFNYSVFRSDILTKILLLKRE